MKQQSAAAVRAIKTNSSVKLHVSEVQIGMYVSALDKDWLETPFLMQGFLIESQEHLDLLMEHCEFVWVDKVENSWVVQEQHAVFETARAKNLIHKIPAQQEHHTAGNIYGHSRRITKTLMEQVRLGRAINTQTVKDTVSDCVQSILRNPDALLWMSRIREQDAYTSEHSLSVCVLAVAFGRYLGFNEKELNQLGLCGMLHDVGKMQIAPETLNKVEKLTAEEWEEMKRHSTYGRDLLMSTPDIYNGAIDVAYSHHEKIDGTGYPRGLKGSAISTYARIIAIVDAYDAMTADRCYAPSMPTTDALKILYYEKGQHFDAYYTDEFIRMIGLYPPGTIVELVNGSVALVLATNYKYTHLPRIILVLDEDKNKIKERVINLSDVDSGRLSKEFLIRKSHVDGAFGLKMRDYQQKGLQFADR